MAEEDAPSDLDVRLEWPKLESQPVTKVRRKPRRATKGSTGSAGGGALVPARAVESVRSDDRVDAVLAYLEDLARTLNEGRGSEGKRDREAKRTAEQFKELTRRMDGLARAIETMPAPTAIAEMLGRVDALASAVQLLSEHVDPGADRLAALRDQIAVSFKPLEDATAEVRRLNETVTAVLAARSDRQGELQTQIDRLAAEVRSLRRRLPVQKETEGRAVADAVVAAVENVLANDKAPRKRGRATKASSTS